MYAPPLSLRTPSNTNTPAYYRAAATAMVKCAQLKGLANQADLTCESPV